MYYDSKIIFACSLQKEADKYLNRFNSIINQHFSLLNPEIKEKSNYKIKFKNNSIIEILKPKDREDVVRGKRAEFDHWCFECETLFDEDVINETVKSFMIFDDVRTKHKPILYCSSEIDKKITGDSV